MIPMPGGAAPIILPSEQVALQPAVTQVFPAINQIDLFFDPVGGVAASGQQEVV